MWLDRCCLAERRELTACWTNRRISLAGAEATVLTFILVFRVSPLNVRREMSHSKKVVGSWARQNPPNWIICLELTARRWNAAYLKQTGNQSESLLVRLQIISRSDVRNCWRSKRGSPLFPANCWSSAMKVLGKARKFCDARINGLWCFISPFSFILIKDKNKNKLQWLLILAEPLDNLIVGIRRVETKKFGTVIRKFHSRHNPRKTQSQILNKSGLLLLFFFFLTIGKGKYQERHIDVIRNR